MRDFQAIIFDFDGVLLESEFEGNRMLAELLTDLGHRHTERSRGAARPDTDPHANGSNRLSDALERRPRCHRRRQAGANAAIGRPGCGNSR